MAAPTGIFVQNPFQLHRHVTILSPQTNAAFREGSCRCPGAWSFSGPCLEGVLQRATQELHLRLELKWLLFVELCGAVTRSHDSFRQWKFELVEEYGECEE